MAYKPAYFEVCPFAIDPNNVYAGLDLSGVCPWVEKYKGDPKYSGWSGKSPPAEIRRENGLIKELDAVPVDKRAERNQNEWTDYANEQGIVIASAPDIYHAGKWGNQNLIDNLRLDLHASRIVTSTRFIFNPQDILSATVVHYHGSEHIKPVKQKVIIQETLQMGRQLDEILDSSGWEAYLQAVFGTNDKLSEIRNVLQKLSGFDQTNTHVYTPSLNKRYKKKETIAYLEIDMGRFNIYGNHAVEMLNGRSRRVLISQ